ncbi:hypothetical protein EV421DRAFT_2017233 [Armillaria borealis]|uniref:Heterokaryon incompatibility domain-containing protein n=1 Tax=Armillaria borealis TaxID=47425 RepID=A0AA39JRJ0_9AGAR|nr:hypothetical protein EV421DRAFT_2017233 [Armillaria borealis]
MDLEETSSIEPQKRWWCQQGGLTVYGWWLKQTISVFGLFPPFRGFWPWYEGTKSPPMPFPYHPNLPEITLSALAETGQAESTIPVLEQRSYTDNQPVISSALADTRCADLGIDGVLEKLNATLGTSYTLGSKDLHLLGIVQMYSILEPYVARNDDFGTVYAHLRGLWYCYDVAAMKRALRAPGEWDREMRMEMLVDGRFTERHLRPRRMWDLYANRVVPCWLACEVVLWAISHAWVDGRDRVNVMTPINGYEWPVPMPKDTNLDLIRIEMLNFGARYAWLDVLCLRQEGGKREDLRLEEWKLDVPAIGHIYQNSDASVVCYFSGLGRPLNLTLDDFESDHCWFRRAWTLQEMSYGYHVGGKTGNDLMDKEVQKRLTQAVDILSEMQNRVSTKRLDKVAGLAYLLSDDRTFRIPIYDTELSEEDAWDVLVDTMLPKARAELFFYYPEPGNRNKRWRPSWQQVMTNKISAPSNLYGWLARVNVGEIEGPDVEWYLGYCIESGDVWGLDEAPKEGKPRVGRVIFKDGAGTFRILRIVARHAYPIPDGSYTLIGCEGGCHCDFWAVGQLRDDGKFEKWSVFHSAEDEVRLWELGLNGLEKYQQLRRSRGRYARNVDGRLCGCSDRQAVVADNQAQPNNASLSASHHHIFRRRLSSSLSSVTSTLPESLVLSTVEKRRYGSKISVALKATFLADANLYGHRQIAPKSVMWTVYNISINGIQAVTHFAVIPISKPKRYDARPYLRLACQRIQDLKLDERPVGHEDVSSKNGQQQCDWMKILLVYLVAGIEFFLPRSWPRFIVQVCVFYVVLSPLHQRKPTTLSRSSLIVTIQNKCKAT